ncbi:hypothetical protein A2U01_0033787 [Trifolium medium]|uniref:Uncharacterized protein n=1 Tax=Trifolium medium TaxID=97028 RepID=A0A392PKS4_9FABA|nr:hypothetical protein [Trifolium medium]
MDYCSCILVSWDMCGFKIFEEFGIFFYCCQFLALISNAKFSSAMHALYSAWLLAAGNANLSDTSIIIPFVHSRISSTPLPLLFSARFIISRRQFCQEIRELLRLKCFTWLEKDIEL